MVDKEVPFTLVEIEPKEKFAKFIGDSEGIFLSSVADFRECSEVMMPDTYRFAKWLKKNKPDLNIEIDKCENVIDLKSVEIWLPLIFLATNVVLPLFLNLVYDYLKSVFRGKLSEDDSKVHFRVIYKEKDKFKEFKYNGPVEGLKNIKQFDINDFMNE